MEVSEAIRVIDDFENQLDHHIETALNSICISHESPGYWSINRAFQRGLLSRVKTTVAIGVAKSLSYEDNDAARWALGVGINNGLLDKLTIYTAELITGSLLARDDSAQYVLRIAFQNGLTSKLDMDTLLFAVKQIAAMDTEQARRTFLALFKEIVDLGLGHIEDCGKVGTGHSMKGYFLHDEFIDGERELVAITAGCRIFGGKNPIDRIAENIGLKDPEVIPREWAGQRNIPGLRFSVQVGLELLARIR